MAHWRKIGLLYAPGLQPEPRHPKLATHAANPLALPLGGDVFRVFYSGRDAHNRSSVGAVDVDLRRLAIVHEHATPVFTHGPPGSFYADGVSIGNCYHHGNIMYMLFMGWQNPPGAHWRGDIGRLQVAPDLSLHLDDHAPLLTRDDTVDPISLSYPWVQTSPQGGLVMWYGSTVTWDAGNGEMLHVLNQAHSLDGVLWTRHGQAIPHRVGLAQAFSRPTVARDADGGWRMWFSYRSGDGTAYRIGCARSDDGSHWTLALDEAGIDVTRGAWDGDMLAYPYVFDHAGARYLLYNGNGYGLSGFGLAVWEGPGQ